MDKIDLNYLKYFYYVVKFNGFTRAGEKLLIQQPVISRAVKLLESQIGEKLIERQRKQVVLTPFGKNIYDLAADIFRNVETINLLASKKEEFISNFTFSTSDSLSIEIMGPIINDFSSAFPNIKLTHLSGPSKMYLDQISNGEIDFGIFFNIENLPKNLEKTKLTSCKFIYACALKHQSNSKVLNSFIATKTENGKLPLFDKYKSINPKAKICATSNSTTSRKSMVETGVGVSLLPIYLLKSNNGKNIFTAINKEIIRLPVYLIERKSSYRFKFKTTLIQLIKDRIEKSEM